MLIYFFSILCLGALGYVQPQSIPPTQQIAPEIRVHVLDGHTGKPIANNHVLIFVTNDPQHHEARLLDRSTDVNGVVLVRDIDFQYLQVFVDWHMLCVKRPNFIEYSVSQVLKSGMNSLNLCGHVNVIAQPGDLYIFARPRHWWELTSGDGAYGKHQNRFALLTAFTLSPKSA